MTDKPSGFSLKVALTSLVVLVIVLVAGYFAYDYYYTAKYAAVLNETIEEAVLESAPSGTFKGAYSYGDFAYEVEVTIESNRIESIKILNNRTSWHARRAEAIVDRVLAKGNVNVDTVSGATVTSKALLKAIELAIPLGDC